MVNPSRRSVAPVRKLVAAIVGTIAVFVMLFGLGMSSWPIVALGAAMLALAIGLALINVVRRGGRAWVAGTAHVVSASEPPASSVYGRCELQLVVAAPGLQASAVKVRDPRVPVAKWPDAGATLPVTVAVDDMRHVRIQWDEVMTHAEATEEPEGYADPLRDLPVDDLLPEPEAPPWVTRDRQQWKRPESEAEPVTADLSGQLDDLRERPVVVRDAPGGPIVLEGTLVETDARPSTAPRRPRPSPRPSPRPRPQPAEPSPEPSPGATGPERTTDADSDPHPAGATTAATTTGAATTAAAEVPDGDQAGTGDRGAAPTDDPPGPAGTADRNGGGSEPSDDVIPDIPDDLSSLDPDSAPPASPTDPTRPATAGAAAQPHADADPEVDLALDEPDGSTVDAGPDARAATDRSDASRTGAADRTGSPWYSDRPLTTGMDVAPESPTASAPLDSPNDSDAAQHPGGNDAVHDPGGNDDSEDPSDSDATQRTSRSEPAGFLVEDATSESTGPGEAASRTGSGGETVPTGGAEAGRSTSAGVAADATNDDATPHSSDGDTPTEAMGHRAPDLTDDVALEPARDVASDAASDVTPEPDDDMSPEAAPGSVGAVAAAARQAPTVAGLPSSAQAADGGTAHSGAREGKLAGVKAAGAKAAGAVAAMARAAGAKAVGMKSTGGKSTAGTEQTGSEAAKPAAAGAVAAGAVAAGSVAAGSVAAGSVAAGAAVGARRSMGSGADQPATSAADRAGAADAAGNGMDDLLTAYPSARPGPAGAIHGVGITALVTDLDRSIRFYRDMLGFFEIDNGGGSAVLASGDTRLVLRTVHELTPTTGRLIYLNLEVGDVDAVYEELRAKGVTFLHEPRAVNRGDRLELWAASFHDPDGHNIAVTQWRAVP